MRAEVELAVGRWLIREGIVSERAVAYALALQARGYHGTPIGEILVELERVEPQVLADALARFAGCSVWDGERSDVEATGATPLPRPAIIVRKTPSVVHYATTEPYDEELREAVRFATGAMSSEPLSATEAMLAHARRKHGPIDFGPPHDALDEKLGEPIDISTEAEEAFRASHASERTRETPPIIRLADLLLLETVWQMPGACLRIELFEQAAIWVGSNGVFDQTIRVDQPKRLLRGVAWRFKQMANLPPGNVPAHGQFQLHIGDRVRSFDVLVESTTRGLAVVVTRRIPAFGVSMAEAWIGPELARRIAEVDAARRSDSPTEKLLRSALATAEKVGEPARIETLYLAFELATLLDFENREAEARPFFEQARALAQELEVGGRIAAELAGLAGRLEVADMSRRAALLAQAEAMLRAPGTGRSFEGGVTLERIVAERASGNTTAVHTAALELEREDHAWFGAPTHWTFHALVLAAWAAADTDDQDGVQRILARTREIGDAIKLPETDAECDLIEGRLFALQGRLQEAEARLAAAQANALRPQDAAIARAERALVLERLGQMREARSEAKAALAVLAGTDAFAVRERAALEALMRRAGPYR